MILHRIAFRVNTQFVGGLPTKPLVPDILSLCFHLQLYASRSFQILLSLCINFPAYHWLSVWPWMDTFSSLGFWVSIYEAQSCELGLIWWFKRIWLRDTVYLWFHNGKVCLWMWVSMYVYEFRHISTPWMFFKLKMGIFDPNDLLRPF